MFMTKKISQQIKTKAQAVAKKQKELIELEKELALLQTSFKNSEEAEEIHDLEDNIRQMIEEYNQKTSEYNFQTRLALMTNDDFCNFLNLEIFTFGADDYFPTKEDILQTEQKDSDYWASSGLNC